MPNKDDTEGKTLKYEGSPTMSENGIEYIRKDLAICMKCGLCKGTGSYTMSNAVPPSNFSANTCVMCEGTGRVPVDGLVDIAAWPGDPIESMPPVTAMLAANQALTLSAKDEAHLLRFFQGDQWDAAALEVRQVHARPAITINRLPALLAASIAADPEYVLKPGRSYSVNQLSAINRLRLIIAHRNRDAQVVYNVMWSNAAERSAAEVEMAHKTIQAAACQCGAPVYLDQISNRWKCVSSRKSVETCDSVAFGG